MNYLKIRLQPSAYLMIFFLLLYGLAIIPVFIARLPIIIKTLIIILICYCAYKVIIYHALKKSLYSVAILIFEPNKQIWQGRFINGKAFSGKVLPESLISPFFIIMRIRTKQKILTIWLSKSTLKYKHFRSVSAAIIYSN